MAERPDTFLLEGVCAPYGETNVWWPVAGGLLARLGLDRNSPPDESRERLVRAACSRSTDLALGSPEFDHVVEVVMHLLGHPSALDSLAPSAARDAVFGGLTSPLRRRAEKSPVVLWIDDLQWAAPLLLDLLESIARHLVDLPLLIITTYRREDDGITDWPQSVDPALTLHLPLAPLSEPRSWSSPTPPPGATLPEKTVRSISARAGGNPLFITELARLAAECPDDPRRAGAARLAAGADRGPARPAHADAAGDARQRRDPRRRGPRRRLARVRRRARRSRSTWPTSTPSSSTD